MSLFNVKIIQILHAVDVNHVNYFTAEFVYNFVNKNG